MATPTITIQNISAIRISDKPGKDTSVVQFIADQPLVEWVARAGGFSPTTGSLVGQSATGGMLSAPLIFARTLFGKYLFASKVNLGAKIILPQGDVAEFIIDNEELFNGDGDYRINIYGKNSAGVWTPYE